MITINLNEKNVFDNFFNVIQPSKNEQGKNVCPYFASKNRSNNKRMSSKHPYKVYYVHKKIFLIILINNNE